MALQSPRRERTSITKRSSPRQVTPPQRKTKSNKSGSMSTGRPQKRAASVKLKARSYKESPEVVDISSDEAGSDNYNSLEQSSSETDSELNESSDLGHTPGGGKLKKNRSPKKSYKFGEKLNEKNKRALKPTKSASTNTPFKRKEMTPRIPSRTIPLPNVVSPLQEAQMRLHVAAVPQYLPCREEEYCEVLSFTEGKILDGTGGCMYISGLPGRYILNIRVFPRIN